MNYEKKFLYCVVAVIVLVLSGPKIYNFCKDRGLFTAATEKKLSMDYFYTNEFEQMYEKHWLATPQQASYADKIADIDRRRQALSAANLGLDTRLKVEALLSSEKDRALKEERYAKELEQQREKAFDEKITEVVRKMIQDGYSHTEAGNIRHRAMQKIKTKWRLNWI